MRNLIRRLRHWLRKPDGKNCRGFCLECKWFELCIQDTAPELQHPELEHMPLPTEYRCCICDSRFECPAYNTGVIFPCAYFKEEHHG